MKDIRIGTSGFDYADWRGVFYPEQLSRGEFLHYYSATFSSVELNFSYYRMPTAKQLQTMVKRAGPKLDFSVKAHQSLTHHIDTSTWQKSMYEYRSALEPLCKEGRLADVLLQFPHRFHYTPDNRCYLDKLLKHFSELPLVVEFRNTQWFNRRVYDALRERNVALCCIDAPHGKGMPSNSDIVTAEHAYVRFHGRNEKNWWSGDATTRFDYLYSQDELQSWIPRIQSIIAQANQLRIFFNNHRRGQAVTNALMLQELFTDWLQARE